MRRTVFFKTIKISIIKTLLGGFFAFGLSMPLSLAQVSLAQDSLAQERDFGQPESVDVQKEDLQDRDPQDIEKAQRPPRSILFPRENPGPYIPPVEVEQMPEEENPAGEGDVSSEDDLDTLTTINDGEKIIVGELRAQSPASFGLFDTQTGGFAKEMWQNTSLEKVEKLLSLVPVRAKSPLMNSLFDRLLLSAAFVPVSEEAEKRVAPADDRQSSMSGMADFQDIGNSQNIQETDRQYIAAKIRKISATGDLAHLTRYMQLLPPENLPLNQEIAENLLLAGDLSAACTLGRLAMSEGLDAAFWYKLLAFCRALEGDMDGANIAIELLMERGVEDFVYFDLINRLMEGDFTDDGQLSRGLDRLDPLTYSLLNVMEQDMAASLFDMAAPLLSHAAATNGSLPADTRLAVAAKSHAQGRFDTDILRSLYEEQNFSEAELETALEPLLIDEGYMGDVLLYQAAARQIDAVKKAEILKIIWQRAVIREDMPRAAQMNKRALRSLQPSNELISHAHHIARGLLLVGDFERARNWYDFVREAAYAGNVSATTALINIWPVILLADQDNIIPWSSEILDLWWNGQMIFSKAERQQKAVLFYALCEALGHNIPENIWTGLEGATVDEKIRPMGLATWRALIRAAEHNRLGETILLNLIAMGADGPTHLDSAGLSALVRSLRAVGLTEDAHALVLEILVNRGF